MWIAEGVETGESERTVYCMNVLLDEMEGTGRWAGDDIELYEYLSTWEDEETQQYGWKWPGC